MLQTVGQMPTITVSQPPPNYDAPHNFFVLAMVATIICALFNLLSLAFGIPAIVLSAMVICLRSKIEILFTYNNHARGEGHVTECRKFANITKIIIKHMH